MRILLIRHGESEANIDLRVYASKGDNKIKLTDNGWRQSIAAGRFLKDYYSGNGTTEWPTIYISSYQRPKETLSGILYGMESQFEGMPILREDVRLIEKFFGAANALNLAVDNPHSEMSPEVVRTLRHLSNQAYENDPISAKNPFGESTKDIMIAVRSLIDSIQSRDIQKNGKDDFMLVTHGAVIQAFIMNWMHVQISDKAKIGNPGNCDIIVIEGKSGNWTVTQIYDGENRRAVHRDVMHNIRPFSYEKLPPVPRHIIDEEKPAPASF